MHSDIRLIKYSLTACLILYSVVSKAQESFIIPELTFSTFNMSQLKAFQGDYISQSGLPLRTVTLFPPYWGYNISAGLRKNRRSSFGLIFGSTSTGGRDDYEDYSGSARADFLLSSFSIGTFHQIKINHSNSWPLYFSYSASWIRTKMIVNEYFTLRSQNQTNQTLFYSNNYGIRPSLVFRKIMNRFYFQTSVGYEFQFTGKLNVSQKGGGYLQNFSGEKITAQWGGLRLSMGLGILLNKKLSE